MVASLGGKRLGQDTSRLGKSRFRVDRVGIYIGTYAVISPL